MYGYCKSLGIKFYRVLQPTLGYGNYNYCLKDDVDSKLYELISNHPTKGILYREDLRKYYDEISEGIKPYSFIYNMSRIFENGTKLFSDHRHPNRKGYDIIAKHISNIMVNE